MNKYKDRCDKCGQFDYLKGYKGKCYCQKCINSMNQTTELKNYKIPLKMKQISLFDLK